MKNKAHNTAITRKNYSVPMRWLIEKGLVAKGMKGLDYGCGKGYDADHLSYDGWDPPYRPETTRLAMHYDVITSIYVLNVIEDAEEREEAEVMMVGMLAPGGTAYIATRNDKCALNGHTSKGTWQGYVEPSTPGWEVVTSNARFNIWKYTKSIH